MRWERLFEDIEAEAAEERRRLIEGEVAERSRYEFGLVTLGDRVGGLMGSSILTLLTCGARIDGVVRAVGADWILLAEGPHRGETLLAATHVVAIANIAAGARVASDERWSSSVERSHERLLLRHLVRGLGRDRASVAIHTTEGTVHCGTVDRVGRDHADLAIHPLDVARRSGSVSETRMIVLDAVTCIRVSRA